MKIKAACVIQGNIRRGTDEVLREMRRHFDVVILSTWLDEKDLVPAGDVDVVLSDKPEAPGYSHRNYQRKGSCAGILRAEELGCTHVLKWRTDMLPTRLDVARLLEWSNYNVPEGVPSRLVTCAFRNLSVNPDWYSSIPDLFAFGHVDMMKMLWGTENIDLSREMNPPGRMLADCGTAWKEREDRGGVFCAESELYAHFRDRLQNRVGKELTHPVIAREYMYLFDHTRLGICWFGATGGFRPIAAAVYYPWWSERIWREGTPVIIGTGYPVTPLQKMLGRWQERIMNKWDIHRQAKWYAAYSLTDGNKKEAGND